MKICKEYLTFSQVPVFTWFRLFYRPQFEGTENIPKDKTEPLIYCGNHRTYADPPLIVVTAKRHVRFLAKEELRKIKKEYGTPRKTEIGLDYSNIDIGDLIKKEDVVLSCECDLSFGGKYGKTLVCVLPDSLCVLGDDGSFMRKKYSDIDINIIHSIEAGTTCPPYCAISYF